MSEIFTEYDTVDEFVVGALGDPGSRVFFVQCRHGEDRITVRVDKQQTQAIAVYLRHVLDDLPPSREIPIAASIVPPFDADFVLGEIGVGYEQFGARILVQLNEIDSAVGGDPIAGVGNGQLRFYLSPAQAYAFCEQSDEVVAGGRPVCRWCDQSIDIDGHYCLRMN